MMKVLDKTENKELINPFFEKPPGRQAQRWIIKNGSDQQQRWLREWENATKTDKQRAADMRLRDHWQKVYGAPEESPQQAQERRLKGAMRRLHRTMNQRTVGAKIDRDEAYNAAKKLLFNSYKHQVIYETGKLPNFNGREKLLMVMHQVAHWLIGDMSDHGHCDCVEPVELLDPRKSLFIYGPNGSGKSTLATAAHQASIQLAATYNTGLRFNWMSMDEMMINIAVDSSLKDMKRACEGNMVLDELREEHVQHKVYGNDINLLDNIFSLRHLKWKSERLQTIITSNVKPKQLMKVMDSYRVDSRLMQQYTTILLDGADFRNPKTLTNEK